MANKSGLGSKELWLHMEQVKTDFHQYASAHAHYISEGGNAGYGSHNHGVVQEGWPQNNFAHYVGPPAPVPVDPLDLEEAAPFIRFVIERMLDLIDSEEKWVKGQSTSWNSDASVEQFCLIGALARAQSELGLTTGNNHTELDKARARVMRTVQSFLDQCVYEKTGHNDMPSFNDSSETSFEDMRLWLKGTLDKLDV